MMTYIMDELEELDCDPDCDASSDTTSVTFTSRSGLDAPAPVPLSDRSVELFPIVYHEGTGIPVPISRPFSRRVALGAPIRDRLLRRRVLRVMGYGVLPAALRRMRRHPWCSFTAFIDFVAEYQHIGFHVKANRTRVAEAFRALRGPAPFDTNARFPDDDYVLLSHPAIASWTEQFMQALDLPDRMIERGSLSPGEATGINSMTDAKRSYDVAMSRLATLCTLMDSETMAKNGIFDRGTFEAQNQLTWTE